MYSVEDEVDGSRKKMWRANDEKYNKLVYGVVFISVYYIHYTFSSFKRIRFVLISVLKDFDLLKVITRKISTNNVFISFWEKWKS